MMKALITLPIIFICLLVNSQTRSKETFPPLNGNIPPQNLQELWKDFDPRKEPLDVEILKEWEEEDVIMQVLGSKPIPYDVLKNGPNRILD